jgi:hypothetical protein
MAKRCIAQSFEEGRHTLYTDDNAGALARTIEHLLEQQGNRAEWADDADNKLLVDVAGQLYPVTVGQAVGDAPQPPTAPELPSAPVVG